MKRIITHFLFALLFTSINAWILPAEAQSHGGGHHGTAGHHGSGGHHGAGGRHGMRGHHIDAGAHLHDHGFTQHMHSAPWSVRQPLTCGRLGWRAHDHHWRSAFDYYGLFDREPGIECVQDDTSRHW